MSLLDAAMEKCVMLDKTTQKDGYGGITTVYVDGEEFYAATVFNSSSNENAASVQETTDLYTITTRKNVVLQYHDVFKRVRDGKVFRVTTNGGDKATPDSASLDMRVVSAEEYEEENEVTDG